MLTALIRRHSVTTNEAHSLGVVASTLSTTLPGIANVQLWDNSLSSIPAPQHVHQQNTKECSYIRRYLLTKEEAASNTIGEYERGP